MCIRDRTCSAVLLGSIFTEAAACAALGVMICRDLRGHSPRAGLHMGQRMAKLCLPLAASDYLRSGLRTIEQFLIPWGLMRAGGSYEAAMAEYGMFGGMVFPVLMFPAAFLYALSDLLVPELARSRAEGNRVRVRHLTQKCLRMGLLFAGAVAGGLFALAPWLGQAIYGLDAPGRLLRILSPMVLSLYMDAIVDGMLKGLGEQVSCVRYNTITMAMDVLLLRALLPLSLIHILSGLPDVQEYPAHCLRLEYAVSPELPPDALQIRDTAPGDPPRLKIPDTVSGAVPVGGAACILSLIHIYLRGRGSTGLSGKGPGGKPFPCDIVLPVVADDGAAAVPEGVRQHLHDLHTDGLHGADGEGAASGLQGRLCRAVRGEKARGHAGRAAQ